VTDNEAPDLFDLVLAEIVAGTPAPRGAGQWSVRNGWAAPRLELEDLSTGPVPRKM
jgi:hypothetical protein